jgi:hypothetical protein
VTVAGLAVIAGHAHARPVNLERTVHVSPVAGNPVASGTRLLAAVADISTASAGNPWLVKVEPGVYDLDGRSLALRPFVDVEGSGVGVTTVRSTVDMAGTVQGADNAELRQLTVENTGPTHAAALSNRAVFFTASRVDCLASGGSLSSTGIASTAFGGVFLDVNARATGSPNATGMSSSGGLLARVRASASGTSFAYGLFNAASTGEVTDVTARGQGAGYAVGIRNEAGAPLLRNVRAIGRGDDISEGIVNGAGSAARIQGAVIEVSGGASFASGIRNEFSSALLTDVTIQVDAASDAFGVSSFFNGNPALRNVTMRVTGGGHVVGVQSYGTQVTVEASTISTSGFSLENEFGGAGTSISVGASRLEGAVEPADGTLRCAASYNQAYAALGAACTP